MTKEEALKGLEGWLEMAAHSSIYCEYDKKCDEAYKVLGHDEYGKIYDKWTSGYVSCSDGLYRRK